MPDRSREFFGAFVCWMFTGFRGKLENHYSRGSGSKQFINYMVGIISIIVIGFTIAWVRFSFFSE